MRSLLHVKPIYIYNFFLILIFSILVNSDYNFEIFYSTIYCFFYFLLIYLGIYYYRKLLYIIFFLYGVGLDLILINEIGPHLLIFMITLIQLKFISKYLYSLSPIKIYFTLLILELIVIFLVMLTSIIFFNLIANIDYLIQITVLSFIMSVPVFLFFSKIDQLK